MGLDRVPRRGEHVDGGCERLRVEVVVEGVGPQEYRWAGTRARHEPRAERLPREARQLALRRHPCRGLGEGLRAGAVGEGVDEAGRASREARPPRLTPPPGRSQSMRKE